MSQLEDFARRGLAAQREVDRLTGTNFPGGFKPRPGCAPGVCRVCGCTENRACDDGCSWVTRDLCSTCARAIIAVADWMQTAHRGAGQRLLREARERAHR